MTYFKLIKQYIETNQSQKFNLLVQEIIDYQRKNADDIIPSEGKINLEIFYNDVNPFHFSRLLIFYLMLGFILLIFLIIEIFLKKRPSLIFS